jgi:integrase
VATVNRLTSIQVTRANTPGMYADGGGLYLQVTANGARTWIYRYQLNKRPREMGLGPAHSVSLAEARSKRDDARKQKVDGVDPIEARKRAKAEALLAEASGVTFRAAAERYIKAHTAGWKNAKHAAQWTATLEAYVYPVVGDLAVGAVDTGLVLKTIEDIWATKPETASRVRGRVESILDWARVRGYRQGENPARWRGHLDKLLPARSRVRRIEHHAALPYADLGTFMTALKARDGLSARALEFAILTAARTGEVIAATWSEFDLVAGTWTVPAERMKAKREHRVPLSDAALKLLKTLQLQGGGEFVFPGGRKKSDAPGHFRPLSNMALLETLRRMERGDLTTHGFRSTFRDWAAERTGYPREVVEMALAHTIADKVEAAYRRGDLFEKRRRLMVEWAKFCGQPSKPAGDLLTLQRGA